MWNVLSLCPVMQESAQKQGFSWKIRKKCNFTAKTANTAKGYIDKPRPLN